MLQLFIFLTWMTPLPRVYEVYNPMKIINFIRKKIDFSIPSVISTISDIKILRKMQLYLMLDVLNQSGYRKN